MEVNIKSYRVRHIYYWLTCYNARITRAASFDIRRNRNITIVISIKCFSNKVITPIVINEL